MSKMLVEIKEYNSNERRFYVVAKEDLKFVNVDEDNDYYFDEDGFTKGFEYNDRIFADDESLDVFNVIEEYKILNTEIDADGTGYDKIRMIIDGIEEIEVWSSRWQGKEGYYFQREEE